MSTSDNQGVPIDESPVVEEQKGVHDVPLEDSPSLDLDLDADLNLDYQAEDGKYSFEEEYKKLFGEEPPAPVEEKERSDESRQDEQEVTPRRRRSWWKIFVMAIFLALVLAAFGMALYAIVKLPTDDFAKQLLDYQTLTAQEMGFLNQAQVSLSAKVDTNEASIQKNSQLQQALHQISPDKWEIRYQWFYSETVSPGNIGVTRLEDIIKVSETEGFKSFAWHFENYYTYVSKDADVQMGEKANGETKYIMFIRK